MKARSMEQGRIGAIAQRVPILAVVLWTIVVGIHGCGDGGTELPPPDPPRPTTVTVTPATAELTALEATVQFSAEVHDQNGDLIANAVVSWSTDDTLVAAVNGSGLVTAVANGAAAITATAGQASGNATVTVVQSTRTVTVSPSVDTIATGGTLKLMAEAFDANGHLVDGAAFAWSSSDVLVATVDNAGLVTGVTEGRATITAMVGDAHGTAELAVEYLDRERAALVALYESTDGANWGGNYGWMTDAPLAAWYGVTVHDGRVVTLQLFNNNLTGPIPPEVGDLVNLRVLELSFNRLTGSIPPELGNLHNLRRLALYGNELTGSIPPQLGDLDNLRALRLSGNELTGSIPPELGNLVNLIDLYLGQNRLTGSIPPELGNLPKLERLVLQINKLSGNIPPELGNLTTLKALYLDVNRLTGPIPPELGKLTALTELQLNNNRLSGPIPPELGNLDKLPKLYIGSNRLSGQIPPELGNLTSLTHLYAGNNRIQGPIPAEFGNLTKLKTLNLPINSFETLWTADFAGLRNLEVLDLRGNNLTELSAGVFSSLERLELLSLSYNRLNIIEAGAFSSLKRLEGLLLSGNGLNRLEAGVFLGLDRLRRLGLEGNPGAPFQFTVELMRTDSDDLLAPGPAKVAVRVKEGAPFDMTIPLAVHGGDVSGSTVMVEAGADMSGAVTATQGGGQSSTQVVAGPVPRITTFVRGIELRVADPLVLFGLASNRAPVPERALPSTRLKEDGEPTTVSASSNFRDPDGDELTYTASSGDPDIVSAGVSGDLVTVTPVSAGSAIVTVTATDPEGLTASTSLPVSVRGKRPGSFDIDLYLLDEVSESIQAAFDDAVDYWSSILAGTELPDVPLEEGTQLGCWEITTHETQQAVDDLVIVATVAEFDGRGGILAGAGICGIRDGTNGLPFMGAMVFDVADLEWLEENGDMEEVILHEIGHVLGIGIVWRDHGLLVNPSLPDNFGADTHVKGPLAVEAFDSAGGIGYTDGAKVPVENRAGPGSGDAHWRESVLDNELMTPYQNGGISDPLSAITIQALADLGYVVDVSLAEYYRLPGQAADYADPASRIDYGDDIMRGPIIVVDRNGRVVRVIPNELNWLW